MRVLARLACFPVPDEIQAAKLADRWRWRWQRRGMQRRRVSTCCCKARRRYLDRRRVCGGRRVARIEGGCAGEQHDGRGEAGRDGCGGKREKDGAHDGCAAPFTRFHGRVRRLYPKKMRAKKSHLRILFFSDITCPESVHVTQNANAKTRTKRRAAVISRCSVCTPPSQSHFVCPVSVP